MSERTVHRFPPGQFTRVVLIHEPSLGAPGGGRLPYLLINQGINNGGVVLARMSEQDLRDLVSAVLADLGRT